MCRSFLAPMATPPTEVVKRAASGIPPGKALDIACGDGRHAIWLNENGWQVTAIDRNAEAIAQIHAVCPMIDARIADLELDPYPRPGDSYDLIVCWLYFQPELYPLIRQSVRPGGIAALCVLTQGRFAADPAVLKGYFDGWRILHELVTERSFELIVERP